MIPSRQAESLPHLQIAVGNFLIRKLRIFLLSSTGLRDYYSSSVVVDLRYTLVGPAERQLSVRRQRGTGLASA